MMKLKATNPLVLFVGALAIGLAGCADDVIITEPPPPPPPPPPEAAEISIVSIVNADDGTEVGESEDDPVSGIIGVAINFDTGGFEAAALDVFVDSDEVPCQTFSGQGAVGLSADVQRVQCLINTSEGVGACQGSTLRGRFANGPHTISATLTLQDGSTVSATRAQPLLFANSNAIIVVPDDIGPRVVGLDAQGWWGGPRDLSWFACPVIFSDSLDDVCSISVSSEEGMWLSGATAPGSTSATSDEPYAYMARYRDLPALVGGIANPDWADSDSFNEDRVEDDDEGVFPTRVLACDGTDITSSFALIGDFRPIDMSAPLCDDPNCEVNIDGSTGALAFGEGPVQDPPNLLYSAGAIDLRDDDGDLVDDFGVGATQGPGGTIVLNAWDFDSGDPDNLVLLVEGIGSISELEEDDACGNGQTTDPDLGGFAGTAGYGLCQAGPDAGGADSYVIQIAEVGDLLGNQLGDGTADLQIEDEFITELLDAGVPTGIVTSGQFGVDRTAPTIDELEPPAEDPLFVWNPDLGLTSPFDPADRTCPDPTGVGCETLMWESEDPDLASGDLGSGVEDGSCTANCADENGDGRLIITTITDSPGDIYNGSDLNVNNGGVVDEMFQAFICDGVNGANCDGTDDGIYTARHRVTDKAVVLNNRAEASYSFVIDASPPVIGFGGITGLNSSNAATVEFVLDASVVDRNGDGTAVASAIVQVTAFSVGPGDCSLGGEDLVTEAQVQVAPAGGNDDPTDNTVIVDVTGQVNTNGGDFSQLFTASNLGAGDVTYCFRIIADDGAERKDGTPDGVDIDAVAGKDFTWQ